MTIKMVGCTNENCYSRNKCVRYMKRLNCEILRRYAPDGVICINFMDKEDEIRRLDAAEKFNRSSDVKVDRY